MRRREDLLPTIIDRDLDFLKDVDLGTEGRKSLTALVLATEDTPDGPVAVYGLPIVDTGEDAENGKETHP